MEDKVLRFDTESELENEKYNWAYRWKETGVCKNVAEWGCIKAEQKWS